MLATAYVRSIMSRLRKMIATTLGVVVILSATIVSAPALAATVNLTVSQGSINSIDAEYPSNFIELGTNTTTLSVQLPAEATGMNLDRLTWVLSSFTDNIGAAVTPVATSFDIAIPSGFLIDGEESYLQIYIAANNGPYFGDFSDSFYLATTIPVISSSTATVNAAFTRAAASEFHVGRAYTFSGDQTNVPVNWGDSIVLSGAAGLWSTGAENWSESAFEVDLDSADLSSEGGVQTFLEGSTLISPDGSTMTIELPASAAAVNWSTDSYLRVRIFESPSYLAANQLDIPINFYPSQRLSGGDRFATAARVSGEFETADVVYVANGRNYPDALSAAPAAAHAGGPLLLTDANALPYATEQEILRLQPARIVVVGGTSVISSSVEAELDALFADDDDVVRMAGADRYETSRLVTADAFGSATNAFLATGTNFPDALAASAAAAHLSGPVVLVPGTASSVDQATLDLLIALGVSNVYLAGGTSVVSSAIESQLAGVFSSVLRKAGEGRYATSIAINSLFSPTEDTVYLAVGTGYADALAGAALAGVQDAPLFTVPGNCVPSELLDAISGLGATKVVLLGGIGVLNTNVGNLVSCG